MEERKDNRQQQENNETLHRSDRENDLSNPINSGESNTNTGLNNPAVAQTRNPSDVGAGNYATKRDVTGSDFDGQ